MTDYSVVNSYSRQFASRQPPQAQKRDNLIVKKQSKSQALKYDTALSGHKGFTKSQKTLVDAFKQHGMRLCDGARLNAVGKGIDLLGRVPPTLSESITALYLSQNNLRLLDGIEQFSAVRLLSVGGNLISSEEEVEKLTKLEQLQNLNLMGNPLCDLPNYRLRTIATVTSLQVLDNSDVTNKERAIALHVAAQDHALRTMVTQNHFDVQKLQRIVQIISLHKTFYGCVMAGVATGKFDRVPGPNDVACNVPLLLRLWKYEDGISEEEKESLKAQLLTIIIRAHSKLADNPREKAKDYLFKLASRSSPRAQLSNGMMRGCVTWEEAYTQVIALQQKKIANLFAICEKNRREMVLYLKELLAMHPRQRIKAVGCQQRERKDDEAEPKPPVGQNQHQRHSWADSRLSEQHHPYNQKDTARSSQRELPPQQPDPETRNSSQVCSLSAPSAHIKKRQSHGLELPAQPARERKMNLRGGDFANKSLGEAIQGFKLRDSAPQRRVSQPSSKMSQIHTKYSRHSHLDISLPQKLIAKPRSESHRQIGEHQHSPAQSDSHEIIQSDRTTKVDTEFNDQESNSCSRDDLDTTSIIARCQASLSPLRVQRPDKERNILEYATLNYHADAQSPITPESYGPVQRFESSNGEPPQVSEHSKPVVAFHDGRMQELEQREEKYIRALMQSEQRELDLRNNLSNVQRELLSYQQTLAQQLHEREAIKDEMTQRMMAIATPKIIKRYFIRWIQYCNWSQQIRHIRRKRCFIVQHTRFWEWRRKIWRQQEVRLCAKGQEYRLRRLYFIEWLNSTRVTVIAKRNQKIGETRFVKRVFQAWVSGATLTRNETIVRYKQQSNNLQRSCFQEWNRTIRYKRALKRVQYLRWQDSRRMNTQLMFWNWKFFLYSVARPLRGRADLFMTRFHIRQLCLHFREWRKLIVIVKVHHQRLLRLTWTRWVTWRRRVQSAQGVTCKENLVLTKAVFCAWQLTTSEQARSKRSLDLAKRYVKRRRLRKLWTYWKYFSMTKRKYTQNSSKALKQYFMRLLRASWGAWKAQAQCNLLKAKAKKCKALQHHFDAFRTGIRRARAQQAQRKMLKHAQKQRQFSLLRQITRIWRRYSTSRKHCKQHAQIVFCHQKWKMMHAVWRRWGTVYGNKLYHQLKVIRNAYDCIIHEKHALAAHLKAAKDRAASLVDEMKIIHEQSKGEDQHAENIKLTLQRCEEKNIFLERELQRERAAINQERHAWKEGLHDKEEKREREVTKYRSLTQNNQQLQVEILALKRELQAEKANVIREENTNEEARAASETAANLHHAEMTVVIEKHQVLERELVVIRGLLKVQTEEREDTANRLQEYEKQIASACEAMNKHEQAHEREKENLRNETASIEAKWKEEQVKYAALNRLLLEKNELILNMTSRLNRLKDISPSSQFDALSKYVDRDALYRNREEWCQRGGCTISGQQYLGRKPDRMSACDNLNQVCESIKSYSPVAKNLAPKQRCRHSEHALSAHPWDGCTRSNILQERKDLIEESLLDNHTSKVHEDIRHLQEQISKRLEQAPPYAQLPPRLTQRPQHIPSRSLLNSCSSLSNDDSDTTEENQSVVNCMRRARLRKFRRQKEALSMAGSSTISCLGSCAQSTGYRVKKKDKVAIPSDPLKKKTVRKSNALKIGGQTKFTCQTKARHTPD